MPPSKANRRDTADPKIKIGGESYWLATNNSVPQYATGTRVLEGEDNDSWEIVLDDFSGGLGGENVAGAGGFLTTEKGSLIHQPTVELTLDVSGVATLRDTPRYVFETQDTNGAWYMYWVSPEQIVKVDIETDPPVVCRVYDVATPTAGFNASDYLGQPVKGIDSGSTYRFFPVNNGDRLTYMPDPVTPDIGGAGSADTFTADTTFPDTGENGAAHFWELPSGAVAMIEGTHASSRTFQNRCRLRILPAGLNFLGTTNWGDQFEVASQLDWAIALMSFEDIVLVRKSDDRWYTGTELETGEFQFRNILPDEASSIRYDIATEENVQGAVWHGRLWLPTFTNLWRHDLRNALPVGPNTLTRGIMDDVSGVYSLQSAEIGAILPAGEFMYVGTGNVSIIGNSLGYHIMAVREDPTDERPLIWQFLAEINPGSFGYIPQVLALQKNGTFDRQRIWYPEPNSSSLNDFNLSYVEIGSDGYPYNSSATYGVANWGASLYTDDHLFPCTAQLTEARLLIEDDDALLTWDVRLSWDGGSYTSIDGAGRTDSGSLFPSTPGTSDNGRRLRVLILTTSAGDHSSGTPVNLRELRLFGYYLPDVGDPLAATIDVLRTAEERGMSPAAVRAELKGYRSSIQAFTDIHNNTGYLKVTDADHDAPTMMGGKEGAELLSLTGEIVEYS